MKFRTELFPKKGARPIDHHSRLVLFGSCFSEHIFTKLRHSGFNAKENSHGILFHPMAMERAIRDCLSERVYTESDLVLHNGTWVSLQHHGRFRGEDPDRVVEKINAEIVQMGQALRKSTHLILTLGTAWGYRYLTQDRIVANCHKIPQDQFSKELVSADKIAESLSSITDTLKKVNPDLTIILTVSPVRHLRDGFVENTRSKAILHEVVHRLVDDEETHYFPSYELMLDDLRDYRFFENDLLHPNEMAVDYVWNKFSSAWFSEEGIEIAEQVGKIHQSVAHVPFDPDSGAHLNFKKKLRQNIIVFAKKHPQVNFLPEVKVLKETDL